MEGDPGENSNGGGGWRNMLDATTKEEDDDFWASLAAATDDPPPYDADIAGVPAWQYAEEDDERLAAQEENAITQMQMVDDLRLQRADAIARASQFRDHQYQMLRAQGHHRVYAEPDSFINFRL